jgi:hypothetical protein
MKNLIFIVLITIILFISCGNPEGSYELRGKVLDKNTKVPVPHRQIIVQGLIKSADTLIKVNNGQFITDSTGCFTYDLHKTRNSFLYSFYLVGDSAYAFSSELLGITELDRYGKFLVFYLNKLTDLIITIERKSKTPAQDTLFCSWTSDGIDGKILYPYKIINYAKAPEQGYIWIGGNIKSAIETKTLADKTTIVWWKLYRNGTRKEFTDTIFCQSDITNYVNFKY